jgi:hypothetical protein
MATNFNVIYTNHSGKRCEATVEVRSSTWPGGDPAFYAVNLQVFGCGKNDSDPIGAVHRLVQDHGQVIAVQPL